MADTIERELGWDDEIEKDSGEFIVLPEGDYDFVVTAFERQRHEPKKDENGNIIGKLPSCWKAVLDLEIESPEGTVTIKHNLFLHTQTEGMLSAFFVGIGQKKHGERIKPNWGAVVGSKGRAKIGIHKWIKDGEEKSNNQVKKFYEPEEAPAAKFTPGAF